MFGVSVSHRVQNPATPHNQFVISALHTLALGNNRLSGSQRPSQWASGEASPSLHLCSSASPCSVCGPKSSCVSSEPPSTCLTSHLGPLFFTSPSNSTKKCDQPSPGEHLGGLGLRVSLRSWIPTWTPVFRRRSSSVTPPPGSEIELLLCHRGWIGHSWFFSPRSGSNNREMSLPFRSRLCLQSASAGETLFVGCWKRRRDSNAGSSRVIRVM